MKLKICLFIIIAALIIIPCSRAHANLKNSGVVVQDSDTGLEWLVMAETMNKSPDRIMAGDYGLKAAGWTHATNSQINSLFLNAGMTGPFNGTSSPWNFDGAKHLLSLFGYTYETNGPIGYNYGIAAFSGTLGETPGTLSVPSILLGDTPTGNVGGAQIPGLSNPSNWTGANWLVRRNPAISSPVFERNSAAINNPYVAMKFGYKLSFVTYGYPATIYTYIEGVAEEIIAQVKCLKVKSYSTYSAGEVYYWLAQDTSGNVWVLQYRDAEASDTRFYGVEYAKIFMPSQVSVGSGLWNPDAIESIVEINVTVPKINDRLGPYFNCLKTKVSYPNGDIDYQYFAPGVGQVKVEFNDEKAINGLILNGTYMRPRSSAWLPIVLMD